MDAHKTVGVLGGMGPAATVEFFRRLVAATPATIDRDHLHILIDNDPGIPDRITALLHGGVSPVPAMVRMAQRLEAAGADVLAMPCNTAHAYIGALRDSVNVLFLDMIEETVLRLREHTVGLLATRATIQTGIYHRACSARGIELVTPEDTAQETVVRAVEAIKASRSLPEVEAAIIGVITDLQARGAEAIVAGCTELSLLDGTKMPVRWFDALDCLVEATIHEAFH